MRTRLKEIRKKHNFTQESLAEVLDISCIFYQSIEQGVRYPGEKTLKKIKQILMFDEDSVLDNEEGSGVGEVTKNITKYMNKNTDEKKYSSFIVSAIRNSIIAELNQRKCEKVQIRGRTNEGKELIYMRIAETANKLYNLNLIAEDIKLYKDCTREEYSDRTKKCTWSMPKVRKLLGYDPDTGVRLNEYKK